MTKLACTPPKKLFALLRYLAIDQNTLAARLDVSHTLVSFWVHGKKPIPTRHKNTMSAVICDALDHDFAHHDAQETQTRKRLDALTAQADPARAHEYQEAMDAWRQAVDTWASATATLKAMIHEWGIEEHYRSGELTRILFEQCRILAPYGARQPLPLSPEDRQVIEDALTEGLQQIRALAQIDPTPAELLDRLKAQEAEQRPWSQGGLRAV